jgi:hypothetical protein
LASGTIILAAVKEDAVGELTDGVYEFFAGQGAQ